VRRLEACEDSLAWGPPGPQDPPRAAEIGGCRWGDVNGFATPSLAAVSLATGASLETWAPAADDAVNWVALAPQGLAVGGPFTALGHPPPGSTVFEEPATVPRGGFALVPALPDAPLGVSAARGDASASVSFLAPAFDGGLPITTYPVKASPGGVTATGADSPIVVGRADERDGVHPYGHGRVERRHRRGVRAVRRRDTARRARGADGREGHARQRPGVGRVHRPGVGPRRRDHLVHGHRLPRRAGRVGAAGPLTVTGLANDTSYTFTVTANSAGTGAASAPSAPVVPAGTGRWHPAPPAEAPRPTVPEFASASGPRLPPPN
jgi:hypothetical protein